MIKVSRPVLYTVVAGVAAYAVVLLTEPEQTPTKRATTVATKAPTAPIGFLPEDLTASFPRYKPKASAPFQPRVVSTRGLARNSAAPKPGDTLTLTGSRAAWKLTGITAVDGVPNALLEDGNDDDSVFLYPGEVWHGLKVATIESDAIVFVNVLGQQTRLPFTDPDASPAPPSLPGDVPVPPKNLLPLPSAVMAPTATAPATVTIEGDHATVQPTTIRRVAQGRNLL